MRQIVLSKQNKHTNDLHEIVSSKNLFHQLFLTVFNAQAINRKFVEETLEIFVTSFITFLQIINEKGLLLHKKEKIAPKESVQDSDHHKGTITEENRLIEDQDFEFEEDYNQYLIDLIPNMLGELEMKYNMMSNSLDSFLTDEIRWLISFLRKNLILEIFQRICPDDTVKEITQEEYQYFK